MRIKVQHYIRIILDIIKIEGVEVMKITTAKNFRDNLSEMIDELIKSNEQLKVTTEMGNVVVLSESHYNGIMETLRIYSNPQEKEKIIEGLHTTIDACVSEDEINRNNLESFNTKITTKNDDVVSCSLD